MILNYLFTKDLVWFAFKTSVNEISQESTEFMTYYTEQNQPRSNRDPIVKLTVICLFRDWIFFFFFCKDTYNLYKHFASCFNYSCCSAQTCWGLSNPLDYSSPGSSVHGIFFCQEYYNGLPFIVWNYRK